MPDYCENILELDRAGAYQQLYDFVCARPIQLDQLVIAAVTLLRGRRVQGAYLIAKMLENRAFNPVLAFAQAVGGYVRGIREDEETGRRLLESQIDALPKVEQLRFYQEFEPIVRTMVGNAFAGDERADAVRRLTALTKAFTPLLRGTFDEHASVPLLDPRALRVQRPETSAPITLESARQPTRGQRVLIALRGRVFPQDPQSRVFEVGPLLQDAMTAYGWDAALFNMEWFASMADDFTRLEEAARAYRPDILVLDEQVVQLKEARTLRSRVISVLRQALPRIKIVGLHLDPWSVAGDDLVTSASDVDLAWTFAPSLPAWRDPAFNEKVLKAPLPYPIARPPTDICTDAICFHGSIASYNWHRWLWLAAAARAGITVQTTITSHKTDNLPPQESFIRYLHSLSSNGSVLNLGMRSDLSVALTGRTFEALAAGALLIQEATPELDQFLVAGEHYLPFRSITELRAVADFIAAWPTEALAIRQRGHQFFQERYAPGKIISYLDRALYK